MTVWGVTAMRLTVAAFVLAACSSDDPEASPTTRDSTTSTTSTTAPERPASTTTTAFDPASVEGEVEAAYLRSWDVYADAVYDLVLDEEALAEVFGGDYLETVTSELEGRIRDGRAAHVVVEHDYDVTRVDAVTYVIVDEYVNHQVLIDPQTKAPIEDDPNETVTDVITLKMRGGQWRVTRIEEFEG